MGFLRRGDAILTRLYYRKQQCIAMLDSSNSPFSLTKTAHDNVESGYYFFQGEELARIFENAFSTYLVSEKTMFRYARRRKVSTKLRQFIHEHTRIEL